MTCFRVQRVLENATDTWEVCACDHPQPRLGGHMLKVMLTPIGYVLSEDGSLCILDAPKPCHGFANGCVCEACLDRIRKLRPARVEPRQPWDVAA